MTNLSHKNGQLLPCVHCGTNDFEKVTDVLCFDDGAGGFYLERCIECNLTRTAPVLSDSQLSDFYKIDYYGTATQKFFSPMEWVVQWAAERMAARIIGRLHQTPRSVDKPVTVLDLGCGRGTLLRKLAQQGAKCTGVERAEFPSHENTADVEIRHGHFMEMDFSGQRFDAIIIWHVLEHLSNPSEVLAKIKSLLAPGGLLLIAVPNYGSFQARLFGKHWFHLDIPRHVFHFTLDNVKSLLSVQQLATKNVSTWSADQSLYGFIQSALNSIGGFKQNELYAFLKASRQRRVTISAGLQVLLAAVLLPAAIVEYAVSGLQGKGSCLIIEAGNLKD